MPIVANGVDAEIVVVGAGMSGLYAALLLQDAGHDVQVVEAGQAIGGRIRTVMLGDRPIDIGGTGLGPSHHRAKALVARFGLATIPLTRRGKLAFSIRGQLMDGDAWEQSAANLTVGEERAILPSRLDSYFMQTLLPFTGLGDWLDPAYAALDIPFGEHLRRHGVSEEAQRLINMCINTNDIETVSALSIFRDAIKWRSVGFDDPKNFDQYGDAQYQPVRVVGGMHRIFPEAMAAALHRPVLTDWHVARIGHDGERAIVTTVDGITLTASRLIVSVPMAALDAIMFEPGLPDGLSTAIREAGRSANTQFVLTTDYRFWEEDGLAPSLWTDTIFERMFVEFDGDEVDHVRVWVNGDNALRVDALGESGAKAALLDTFAEARPSTAGHLTVHHMVSWGGDPLIRGEKYVMAPGHVSRFARELATPAGPIHWAGEHHKSLEVGIEAALQSGERAATEVQLTLS